MNLNKALDKKFESLSLKQLLEAPVSALEGVSESDAKLLEQAFGVRTIRDLGTNKYLHAAVTIVQAAELEG